MVIQDASDALKRPSSCTEFQLHVDAGPNVIDFTKHRLLRCIERAKDPRQRLLLVALAQDYVSGQVAVAWRRGRPVLVRLAQAA